MKTPTSAGAALVIGLAAGGCGTPPADSPPPAQPAAAPVPAVPDEVTGKVVGIQELDPPRLMIDGPAGQQTYVLEETRVRRGDAEAEAGIRALQEGQTVRVRPTAEAGAPKAAEVVIEADPS